MFTLIVIQRVSEVAGMPNHKKLKLNVICLLLRCLTSSIQKILRASFPIFKIEKGAIFGLATNLPYRYAQWASIWCVLYVMSSIIISACIFFLHSTQLGISELLTCTGFSGISMQIGKWPSSNKIHFYLLLC